MNHPVGYALVKMMNHYLACLVFCAAFSCATVASEGVYRIDESVSPIDFLNDVCSRRSGLFLVKDSVRGWLQRSDVLVLIELVDSETHCRSVALAASSRFKWNGSTLGDEAAFLVEGYRQGVYPPGLTSEPLSDADRLEVMKWWGALANGK